MAERTEITPKDWQLSNSKDSPTSNDVVLLRRQSVVIPEEPRSSESLHANVGGPLPPRSSKSSAGRAGSGAAAPEHAAGVAKSPAGSTGAGKKPPKSGWRDSRTGRVLELLAYLAMLVLVLIYFTGKGLFIYEGF